MGMYTGLRVKVKVKEEYRQMVKEINEGEEWNQFAEQFSFLSSYATQRRAEFIPRGTLSYMPDSWEIGNFPRQVATDGFDRNLEEETGYWSFQCSLKNYNEEIEQFLKEVLPVIISEAKHIEVLYEEWEKSILYEFVDGEIKVSGKTINYSDDGDESVSAIFS